MAPPPNWLLLNDMKFSAKIFASIFLIALPSQAAILNYVVTGYASSSGPIMDMGAGATTDVFGAGASGGPNNTRLVPAGSGTFVDFTIGNADAIVGDQFLAANINSLPTVATLRVTLQAISGGGTEVMIARTSNSQGLTDIGTMTFLLTGLDGLNSNTQANSATLNFEWRNASNDGPLVGSNQIVFTSYDIDFTQRNRIAVSDYSVLSTATSPATRLTTTTGSGTTAIFDAAPGTDSVTNDARNGYAFLTVAGDTTQTIAVDKVGGGVVNSGFGTGGNQLYMFAFRSPSPLLPVIPETSTAVITCLGVLTMLRRRRA